jgi:hypothetical protein
MTEPVPEFAVGDTVKVYSGYGNGCRDGTVEKVGRKLVHVRLGAWSVKTYDKRTLEATHRRGGRIQTLHQFAKQERQQDIDASLNAHGVRISWDMRNHWTPERREALVEWLSEWDWNRQ